MTSRKYVSWILALAITLGSAGTANAANTVALFNDTVVEIKDTLADPTDLWVSPEDLTRLTGFVLKPEGACFADICIPIKQDADSDKFVTRLGKKWVNVSALATALRQGVAVDRESNTWSFGEIPSANSSSLAKGMAPDFAMKDREGKTVRLSDYRGKKVVILTWASW